MSSDAWHLSTRCVRSMPEIGLAFQPGERPRRRETRQRIGDIPAEITLPLFQILEPRAFSPGHPGTACLATISLSLRDKSHRLSKRPRSLLALMGFQPQEP